MPNVVLVVIDEPERGTRPVLYSGKGALRPLISDDGDINLLCGECGFYLAENATGGQMHNVVFQCPRCKRFNETRT